MSYQALSVLPSIKKIVLVKKSASFQCIMTMPLLGQISDVCARIQSPFAGPSCHVIHILHNASVPLQFQTKLGCWMDFVKLCGYLSMTTSSYESTIKSPDYRLILGQYLCLYSQTPIKRHLILKTVTIYEAVNRQISKRHLHREKRPVCVNSFVVTSTLSFA